MKEGLTMKKSTMAITASMILIGLASSAYAGEILGYPIVAKQAKFYSIILGVIAASVAMVSISYLCFWLADLKKRATVSKPVEKASFAGELVAAAQSAK
jgi:mannitol-specific phosphotransferase system IIBC component